MCYSIESIVNRGPHGAEALIIDHVSMAYNSSVLPSIHAAVIDARLYSRRHKLLRKPAAPAVIELQKNHGYFHGKISCRCVARTNIDKTDTPRS